jgi:hypothetical protein
MENEKKISDEELELLCARIAAAHAMMAEEEEVPYSQAQTMYENNEDSDNKRE